MTKGTIQVNQKYADGIRAMLDIIEAHAQNENILKSLWKLGDDYFTEWPNVSKANLTYSARYIASTFFATAAFESLKLYFRLGYGLNEDDIDLAKEEKRIINGIKECFCMERTARGKISEINSKRKH